MKYFRESRSLLILAACGVIATLSCRAYDYEGHRLVNELALDVLPDTFPAFVKSAVAGERIAFLGGEPDRWRNTPDLSLRHANSTNHFLDVEDLASYETSLPEISPFRYEFVMRLGRVRAAHPDRFPAVPETNDLDRTQALPGFLPWRIAEDYGRLRSMFSYWKAYQEGGTSDEKRTRVHSRPLANLAMGRSSQSNPFGYGRIGFSQFSVKSIQPGGRQRIAQ